LPQIASLEGRKIVRSIIVNGVPNRYFTCYQDGTIKGCGIETRRHDTRAYFARFQREILEIMAKGNNIKEVKALMPEVNYTFQKYKQQLKEGRVPLVDLVFTKMLSKVIMRIVLTLLILAPYTS
jgi:DNA polymerase elongation subunit (family B)